ncbi:MAG: hypothetical protein ACJA15_001866 [Flavobacteriales bacterium]|jgi:hypothetical protein
MRFFIFCILFTFGTQVLSQNQPLKLEFQFTYGDEPIVLSKKYPHLSPSDSIQFNVIKIYVGNFVLSNEPAGEGLPQFFLLDLSKPESLAFSIESKPFLGEIGFQIGIDSLTNVSGAMEGALDPLNGMYWTWQSGYINIKIEGVSSLSSGRNDEFQYHLGGYQFPKNAVQRRSFETQNQSHLIFELPLDELTPLFDFAHTPAIMSPSPKAVELSAVISSHLILIK